MKLRVIIIDESQYWEPEYLKQIGGRVRSVWYYKVGEKTFCCETTPSYLIVPVEPWFEIDDDSGNLTDEWSRSSDPFYMHVSDAAKMPGVFVDIPDEMDADEWFAENGIPTEIFREGDSDNGPKRDDSTHYRANREPGERGGPERTVSGAKGQV